MPDPDLFGESPTPGALVYPMRTMIEQLYVKRAFNLSNKALVERWGETPRWQYFSGQSYYQERLPCDATTLVKFLRPLAKKA